MLIKVDHLFWILKCGTYCHVSLFGPAWNSTSGCKININFKKQKIVFLIKFWVWILPENHSQLTKSNIILWIKCEEIRMIIER